MKQGILLIFTFFFSCISVFANSVEIFSDKNTGKVGDEFIITLKKTSENNEKSKFVGLEGIQNFTIFSRSQSTQVEIINGDGKSIDTIQLQVIATKSGTFEIGPAVYQIGDEELKTETIEITVEGNTQTKLEDFSGNQDQNNGELNQENNNQQKSGEINNINEISGDESEKIEKNFEESRNLEIRISDFSFLGIIFLLFLILFYFILIKILKKSSENTAEIKNIEKRKQEAFIGNNEKFLKKLEKLSHEGEYLEKQEFYSQLNTIYREYFEFLGIVNAYSKTLKELQNDDISEKLFSMFEKSYYEEFNDNIDSSAQRKQMIMNFMIYLK